MTSLCYLVFDITDAHVARRVEMLRAAGAVLSLVGFRRSDGALPPDMPIVDLGVTENGALGKRILSVANAILRSAKYRRLLLTADIVVARNLEMLAIAAAVLGKKQNARLVYESLDVHRSLSGNGFRHRLLRWLEQILIRRCDLLVTSSPRFLSEHFERDRPLPIPHVVVENKVPALGAAPRETRLTASEPPWTIGWFGRLRCRKSLSMLARIATASDGRVQVLIAGRPSYNEMPDFDEVVATSPGLRFLGLYLPDDLPRLYGQTHFAWCIDYMEEGQNSSWLLPNRVYEASVFGAVPIALNAVETGAWLQRHNAGIRIEEPATEVTAQLVAMTEDRYKALLDQVRAIPRKELIATREEADALLATLAGRDLG